MAEIVESIRKKKTFKQLVTYNIQLLEKAVAVGKDRYVAFQFAAQQCLFWGLIWPSKMHVDVV